MTRIEDIIKEKLNSYESPLPSGDLEKFESRIEQGSGHTYRVDNSRTLIWTFGIVSAIWIALLLIPKTNISDKSVISPEDRNHLAQVEQKEEEKNMNIDVQPFAIEKVSHELVADNSEYTFEDESADNSNDYPYKRNDEQETVEEKKSNATQTDTGSPFRPLKEGNIHNSDCSKVGIASAGVIGGSGIAALASFIPALINKSRIPGMDTGEHLFNPIVPHDDYLCSEIHYMPLRLGVSLWIPVNDRWAIETGLDYSLYSSKMTYTKSGELTQTASYLGIPLYADYIIAQNKWLSVYTGAGVSFEYCINASISGKQINQNRFSFSIAGTGGIQFNISNNLGIYLAPSISWTPPVGQNALKTYRTEHRVMFSVNSGIRIRLGNTN